MNINEVLKLNNEIALEKVSIVHVFKTAELINQRFLRVVKPYDLSLQQYNVLRILKGQKGKSINLKDVSSRMVSPNCNTSRLVDKLLAKNLITRTTDQNNRRKVDLTITANGLDLLEKIDPIFNSAELKLLENINEEQLIVLNQVLDQIRNNINL